MASMSGTDNNEPASVLRLTKDVRRQLLEQNDGFTTKTNYADNNFNEDRTYTIRDSELHIGPDSNTSWADSRRRSEHLADKTETHRFLHNNPGLLDQDDFVVGGISGEGEAYRRNVSERCFGYIRRL